ncbi:hypothetical protein EJB05_13270, partial [Eragrostis curvula]
MQALSLLRRRLAPLTICRCELPPQDVAAKDWSPEFYRCLQQLLSTEKAQMEAIVYEPAEGQVPKISAEVAAPDLLSTKFLQMRPFASSPE